jgi:hypothetical protein
MTECHVNYLQCELNICDMRLTKLSVVWYAHHEVMTEYPRVLRALCAAAPRLASGEKERDATNVESA